MLLAEIDAALGVGAALDALAVPWLIGGSVASSLLGVPRATADVDLVADLRDRHVHPLFEALVGAYYLDEEVVRWAVATRRSFNAIHLESLTKVDVFCGGDDALSREEIDRRISLVVGERTIPVATAEDIVLQKLLWYVAGGRVSDRQWQDVLGVVRVNAGALDLAYLRRHAVAHGIDELLERALR